MRQTFLCPLSLDIFEAQFASRCVRLSASGHNASANILTDNRGCATMLQSALGGLVVVEVSRSGATSSISSTTECPPLRRVWFEGDSSVDACTPRTAISDLARTRRQLLSLMLLAVARRPLFFRCPVSLTSPRPGPSWPSVDLPT